MESVKKDYSILIIEDDKEMQTILKMYLTKFGFNIKLANNAEEAIDRIRNFIPDLIISDIMMPGINGLEFRNKLLKNPEFRIIPFIFLTALGKIEEKIAGLKLYVDDYIVKPFDMAELLVRIQSTLKRNEFYNDLIKFDSLTQLYNRNTFLSELEKEIKRTIRYKLIMSVAILDLDHFKNCNDTYGHVFGDSVLAKISNLMSSVLRDTDFAGRYGGEEFLIAMPETDKESAVNVIERIRKKIEGLKFDIPGFKITLSAGIASIPGDSENADGIIKAADIALYRAKHNGRNIVEIFDNSREPDITII